MTTIIKTHTGGYEFRPSECPHCEAPTLVQTPNNDNCENCGYWHCYSDGEGWIPENSILNENKGSKL